MPILAPSYLSATLHPQLYFLVLSRSLWFPISLSWFHNSIDSGKKRVEKVWPHHNDLNWHPQLWQRHRSRSSTFISTYSSSSVVALNQTPQHFTLDDAVSPCPQELLLRSVQSPCLLCTLLLVVWQCHDMIANRKMSRKITFPRVLLAVQGAKEAAWAGLLKGVATSKIIYCSRRWLHFVRCWLSVGVVVIYSGQQLLLLLLAFVAGSN